MKDTTESLCVHETSVAFILFGQGQTHKCILCTHVQTCIHTQGEREETETNRQADIIISLWQARQKQSIWEKLSKAIVLHSWW